MTFYLNPAVCLNSQKKTGQYVGMDFDNQVYALLSVFGGENTHFLFGQQNITQKICYWQVTGTAAVLFPFSAIFPAYCVHWLSAWVYVNNKTSLMCVYLQVNFLLSRAQLDLKSKSVSQLVIMSTMIFHSPENIQLRKEKSLWTKSLFGA